LHACLISVPYRNRGARPGWFLTVRRESLDRLSVGLAAVAARWVGQEPPGTRLPTPQQDPEGVRRLARQVLARTEFKSAQRPLILRLLDDLNRVVNGALNRLARGPGSLIGLVMVVAVVAAAVVLALRVLRRLAPDPSRSLAIDVVVGRSAVDWRAEAARHEASRRWRDALRCRYRALIAELAERDLVAEIPGRTSGEYRREISGSVPSVAADFGAATDLFERAWYGHAPTGADDSAEFADLAGRVMAGVP